MRRSCTGENQKVFIVAEEIDGQVIGIIGMTPPSEAMRQFTSTGSL